MNSDLQVEDVRSMCCRLNLDLRELKKRNGGLFGSADSTGSIGVGLLSTCHVLHMKCSGDKRLFLSYWRNVWSLPRREL